MAILCNILVGLAALVTVLLFPVMADLAKLAGPDRTGADIILFVMMSARWLLMAIVLTWCVVAGRFDWIWGGPGARWLAVLGTHAGLGFVAVITMAMTMSKLRGLDFGAFTTVGWVGVPVLVMLITSAAINGEILGRPGPARWLHYGLAGLAAAGWIIVGGTWIASSIHSNRERAQGEAARQAESDAQQAAWNAKQAQEDEDLERMSPSLPIDDWIVQTHIQYSEKHQKRAAELIAKRPRLVRELTEMLGRDDPMQREYAISFIRELKPPPRDLIGPLAAAEKKLAEQLQAGIDSQGEMPSHPYGMSKSTLMTAQALGEAPELRDGLEAILSVIEKLPESPDLKDLAAQYHAYLHAELAHARTQ